jgi:hypothetical protein
MYIKYLENIHNLSNYNSIVKGGEKNNCIYLQIENGNFHSMKFNDEKARDFILSEIWTKIVKKVDYYDIDNIINDYYVANKYNIV